MDDMESETENTTREAAPGFNRRVLFGGVAALIVIAAAGIFLFTRGDETEKNRQAAREEMQQLVETVGKLMILPDEEPIIATVADPSQLADQAFFRDANIGDKVLIYNQARKAVLYRPNGNLIVDIAPLSAPSPASPTPGK
jgi:hypothetical protein